MALFKWKKDGKDLYKLSDGSSYEGEFKENKWKRNYIWEYKRKYESDWVNKKCGEMEYLCGLMEEYIKV